MRTGFWGPTELNDVEDNFAERGVNALQVCGACLNLSLACCLIEMLLYPDSATFASCLLCLWQSKVPQRNQYGIMLSLSVSTFVCLFLIPCLHTDTLAYEHEYLMNIVNEKVDNPIEWNYSAFAFVSLHVSRSHIHYYVFHVS